MKASLVVTVGALLVASPVFAQSLASPPQATSHKAPHHRPRSASHHTNDNEMFRVVVGSDVKITPSGEVLVPPTSIISVHEQPTAATPPVPKAPVSKAPATPKP